MEKAIICQLFTHLRNKDFWIQMDTGIPGYLIGTKYFITPWNTHNKESRYECKFTRIYRTMQVTFKVYCRRLVEVLSEKNKNFVSSF